MRYSAVGQQGQLVRCCGGRRRQVLLLCCAPREPLPTGHPTPIPASYDGVSTPGGDANPGLYATFGPIDMEADGVFVTPLAAASADATQM